MSGLPVDFGAGSIEGLPDVVRRVGPARVFLVTDAGLRRAGIVDRVRRPAGARSTSGTTASALGTSSSTRS